MLCLPHSLFLTANTHFSCKSCLELFAPRKIILFQDHIVIIFVILVILLKCHSGENNTVISSDLWRMFALGLVLQSSNSLTFAWGDYTSCFLQQSMFFASSPQSCCRFFMCAHIPEHISMHWQSIFWCAANSHLFTSSTTPSLTKITRKNSLAVKLFCLVYLGYYIDFLHCLKFKDHALYPKSSHCRGYREPLPSLLLENVFSNFIL